MKELTLEDLKILSLELLVDIHSFCIKNNIQYSLYGGTMIGAIRHKGFIPWDDDIDIAMLRPDYERFIQTYHSEKGYKLFHAHNSNAIIGFARVCEMQKTYATFPTSPWIDIKTGIWIDIFPLDIAPDDRNATERHIASLKKLQSKMYAIRKCNTSISSLKSFSLLKSYIKSWKHKLFIKDLSENQIAKQYISLCKAFEECKTLHICNFSYLGFGIKEYQIREDVENVELIDFERNKFMCFTGYNRIMKSKYGDYMKLPPIEERRPHHPMKTYWKI